MSTPYGRLASQIEEAIQAVDYARAVRDDEQIKDFRDLDLIIAELRAMRYRASTTRFVAES